MNITDNFKETHFFNISWEKDIELIRKWAMNNWVYPEFFLKDFSSTYYNFVDNIQFSLNRLIWIKKWTNLPDSVLTREYLTLMEVVKNSVSAVVSNIELGNIDKWVIKVVLSFNKKLDLVILVRDNGVWQNKVEWKRDKNEILHPWGLWIWYGVWVIQSWLYHKTVLWEKWAIVKLKF